MKGPTTPALVSPPEAAKYLGISSRTLRERSKDGLIPVVKIGKRCPRYSLRALDQFIESQLAGRGGQK